MKILIIGDWQHAIYEKAIFDALVKQHVNVIRFNYGKYYTCVNVLNKYLKKIEDKYAFGFSINKLNKDLVAFCKKTNPDVCFVYRGRHLFPQTIKYIKQVLECKMLVYNNDDPFALQQKKYFWRHFLKSIVYYDWNYVYREKNISDFKRIGLKNVSLLRSYYIKASNYPMKTFKKQGVVFIGHYENDRRDILIRSLYENNINIKLYGTQWHKSNIYQYLLNKNGFIRELSGVEYNSVINKAKIALVFLSKQNNDTYTRRNFEIPATKTFMLSEYSDDLAALFEEGVEAEYFRSKEEMLEKIIFYLKNDKARKKIAEAGYKRLIKDGHEVSDRARQILRQKKRMI
jgi:hypothetical protein